MRFSDRGDRPDEGDSPERNLIANHLDQYARPLQETDITALGRPQDRRFDQFSSLSAAGTLGNIIGRYTLQPGSIHQRDFGTPEEGRMEIKVERGFPGRLNEGMEWSPFTGEFNPETQNLGAVEIDRFPPSDPNERPFVVQGIRYNLTHFKGDLGIVSARFAFSPEGKLTEGERYAGARELGDLSGLVRRCLQ